MSERGPEEYSPEHSRKLLPSEVMFTYARQFQQEINTGVRDIDELDSLAKLRCSELNDVALQVELIGEKMSVDAEQAVVANGVHQKYESQRIDGRQPDGIERLERLTGEFAGYGYYIMPARGGYSCVLGAKIITEYDKTLPFSDVANVVFCPVGLSQPEFEREQKDRKLEVARMKLREAIDDVEWSAVNNLSARDIVRSIVDIDEVLIGHTIEDVDTLNKLSFMVPLLLMKLESVPDATIIIDRLLDALSIQLELPQKLALDAYKYRSQIGTSTGWMIHADPQHGPRRLDELEAYLMIAPAAQRSELFLSGIYEDRAVQVLLSDIVAATPLQ